MNLALLVFIICFILIFLIRIPIAPGMLMASLFYFAIAQGPAADLSMAASQFLTNMNSKFVLIAVPLFVFMAEVMNSGKVTDMIFRFANAMVGRKRGALGHVNVVASIIFSGMTGSALADASGLGMMEIKAMNDHGYERGFSSAITAASATIGPIFPPSIPMIFYSMLSGASIGALFMGGMVPGILIGLALMAYIAVVARIRDYPRGEKLALRDTLAITIKSFPALLSIVVLLGGIYSGIVTPTEAGALAALYAILISFFVYRAMGPKDLVQVILRTVKTTGTLSLLVGTAYAFSYIVAIEHIPAAVAGWLLTVTQNKYVLLLLINIVFIILGMFIDTMCITLVFIPIVLPLVNTLGIDLVHFGVMITLNMMIGLSTPPFGMLLFVVSGISKTPLKEIIKEILPMLLVLFAVLFMVTYIPQLVTFLPTMVGM
ncbi:MULTISPECIES: TRAP transporter large permease [unclassified Oceanispirochaeta]|uniref:TRAP transporter large permease n=1 Tax=unclassified Oceanispirochaeta TaxID=2635722 RepID=UPI000E097D81|nr:MULTISPECIES: TRAP transporter large permease [unclassified Oceanispirochaeta]MBF9017994.1 TRAP transporter large permease [Oceanispirochaeta sp. M2]NPD74506.1 TRAP transporter large permease [Oceanispirochaeta sp. M1]RDG29619.1 TRAP transporter large permease [Oceanispirochaeta sp. M1]